MKRIVILVLLAGVAAGCASTSAPDLYTLNMAPSAGAGSPVNIAVGRMRVAEPLQNKRILIKKSATEIEYYAAAQWAAALDEMLLEKLALEFGPADLSRDSLVISGALLAFEQIDTPGGVEAHVRLSLEFRKAGMSHYSTPELAKVYDVRKPVDSPTPNGVVQTLSMCLEQVARDIVADASGI